MLRMRKVLGGLVLVVITVEVALVLTGLLDFGSAARVVIALEACLSVFVVVQVVVVVKAVRRATTRGMDLPVVLDASLSQFFPVGLARYLRQDLMLIRAIFMLATGRRDVAEGEQPIAYSGPLVVMMVALTAADGIVAVLLHRLLPPGVRNAALVLGVIGLVWLMGFVASLICYPHVVSAGRLRLRFSVFHDLTVPAAAIRSAGTTARDPDTQKSAERFDDEVVLAVGGRANVVVDLDATGFFSLSPRIDDAGTLRRVTFYADQPTQVRDLLRSVAKATRDPVEGHRPAPPACDAAACPEEP